MTRVRVTRSVRLMAALGAALGGWLVGAAVVIAFEILLVAGSPRTAPLVGAACGMLLLGLELRVFFGEAPWPFQGGAVDPEVAYPLTVAGIVGATMWSLYTALVRWWLNEGREPEP